MSDASRLAAEPARPASLSTGERLGFALRQAGVLALCLIVGGFVVERLRPLTLPDRGIVTTPFVWAAIVWTVLLVVNAVGLERVTVRGLERAPLAAAGVIAALTWITGIANVGTEVSDLVFSVANAIGALLFWWGVFGLLSVLIDFARRREH